MKIIDELPFTVDVTYSRLLKFLEFWKETKFVKTRSVLIK